MTQDGGDTRVRLDKWLWAARFYKTRTLAVEAIDTGHVRVDDEHAKPARAVKVGDRVSVKKQGIAWIVEVIALSDRRGGAADAAKLYRESAESVAAREAEIARRRASAANASPWSGRPTKRQRRKLEEFLDES